MEVNPIAGVGFFAVLDEVSGIALLLADPAPPQILNAFLVPSRANYSQGMEIYCPFNDIGWFGFYPFTEDRVPLE